MGIIKDNLHVVEGALDEAKMAIKEHLNLFDPVIIYPYRGYGNMDVGYIEGRILEREGIIHGEKDLENSLWNNIRKAWKRYESDEVPGVTIEGTIHDKTVRGVSDGEGYFLLEFKDLGELDLADGWHEVDLRIVDMPFDLEYEDHAVGEILVSRQAYSFGIISDVDDTIIETHAMTAIKKITTTLTKDAESRVVFEGVQELYRALIQDNQNPLFFVSGSSYNLYDMLVAFCEYNDIPKAPFLLRDLGLDTKQWIKQDTLPYKKEHIEHILNTYPKLDFICIGDSGQHDPEIYLEIHRQNPGRLRAVYIRHVHTDARLQKLREMEKEFDIPFLVMEHSHEALEHARGQGWI